MLTWYGGFHSVDALCATDARARVFVAGGGREGVVAIDGASGRPRGVWVNEYYATGLFADSACGKLYCLCEREPGRSVCVVDPLTNKLLAALPLSAYPRAMASNTVDHKVYVSASSFDDCTDRIVVLDAVGDTVLTEIPARRAPDFLAYDADDDLVYAASNSSDYIWAIDGKTDRVVDSCWVSEDPIGLLYNRAQHRLYCTGTKGEVTITTPLVHGHDNYITVGAGLRCLVLNSSGTVLYGGSPKHDSIYVIDCVEETLVCAMSVAGPPVALCYDSQHDRLYSASTGDSGALSVIDCSNGVLVDIVPVSSQFLYYDSVSDAVYCLGDGGLTVVDGQTRTIVRTFVLGSYPVSIASAPGWSCVYVAGDDDPYLSVIRKAAGPAEMGAQATLDGQATVVRGRLDWTGTLAVMYDKSGRRVGDVHRGGNNVSRLQPGVYFVRQNGVRRGTYARKIMITR